MKLLICGDVVGHSGRTVILDQIPKLRDQLALDFVIVNGENAAHGFGITQKISIQFYNAGVDAITTGNHVWDQRELMNTIDKDPKILRPINYPDGTPGRGKAVFDAPNGKRVMIIHPMGRLFMDPLDDPFAAVEGALANHKLGGDVDVIIVDIHAEATSEKMAMGHLLDGRVSAVVGTHSHVPTADAQILVGGTGYQTDLGMTGDYDSVIGMQKKAAIERFTTKLPAGRLEPAGGEATLCAIYLETDDRTGLATRIEPVRIGGRLKATLPDIE